MGIKVSARRLRCRLHVPPRLHPAHARREVEHAPVYAVLIALFRPLFPLVLRLSKSATSSERVGWAMLKVTLNGFARPHVEGPDINALAAAWRDR